MKTSWLVNALKLLKERPHNLTYAKIASETDITESWLRAFVGGGICNPSVNKIETLTKYLERKR